MNTTTATTAVNRRSRAPSETPLFDPTAPVPSATTGAARTSVATTASAEDATSSTVDALWADLWATGSPATRNELVVQHLYLVDVVVRRLPSSLVAHWSFADFRSFGTIGLIDAVDRRRSDLSQIPFAPYALYRIRGAIFDELRKLDWLPRTLRRRVIEFRETEDSLRTTLRHRPSRDEVLSEMGVTEQHQVLATMSAIRRSQFESLQDPLGDDDETPRADHLVSTDDPEAAVIAQCESNELKAAISRLPLRQRTIISYRFVAGLTQQQVGDILGVSNTRICQLEGQALRELRRFLTPDRVA
jgi:RNA polymerase sigma factor for flagellar operon FliA